MKKNITFAAATCVLAVGLAVSASALDGGRVDVNTKLNVREKASTSSSVKASLASGQLVTLHGKSGQWWNIEYAPDKFGYVHGDYIDELNLTVGTVSTSWGSLNVRSGASTASAVIGKLPKGEKILILGKQGSFYKVLYNGNSVGYASASYITTNITSNYSTIDLNLTSYKQYDKAYASLRLPGSYEPISTHGCAVTVLAMTESYRTGKTVTPKNVIEKENFTSSGALYWPSVYTRGENTLEFIYSKLAAGKPVIVHAKKANGSAHFAVVTGFSGSTLEAKNFKILDPGSAYRTTLSSLYSAYPTLIKTISY